MGLDLWFREDVARILASTHEAMRATSEALAVSDGATTVYRQGYEDALRAVAVAFGLLLSERALPPLSPPGWERGGNGHLRVWNGGRE